MKKRLFTAMLLAWFLSGALAAQADQDAFEKAKVLIFDKQWAPALQELDEVIARHVGSRYYATALFYRGKCQEELGLKKQALESYEKFIKAAAKSNLAEEALISIIDLAASLYQGGEKEYLGKMLGLLGHGNKVVSYYAAFKLSYLPDRGTAVRALPVLQTILDREKDEELRDRARIAIMRIDPSRLKETSRADGDWSSKMLKIRVSSKSDPGENYSLNIPLALADLALKALGNEEKQALQKQGYNLNEILSQLTGKGLKIDINDEDSIIKIWVE
jgi:tetratricopeptide (TPR) repeat protein